MPSKVTAKKKGQWRKRLYDLKERYDALYDEITGCGVGDDQLKVLAHQFFLCDDAIAEIDALKVA